MHLGLLWSVVVVAFLHFDIVNTSVIKIGAVFTEDQKDSVVELAFKYAIYRINNDKNLLPSTTLVYDIVYVPNDDSFHATKKGLDHSGLSVDGETLPYYNRFFITNKICARIACNQIENGVYAMFGPSDPLLGSHIHSICDALDIPHLEIRPDYETNFREFSINLYPMQHLLNSAFVDVMTYLNWTRVAIIYEENYGIVRLKELIRTWQKNDLEIHLRQVDSHSYRSVLKEINDKEIFNIIIDTKPSDMQHFLKVILQLQMNDYKYHYLLTTFDIDTYDLTEFQYNFVNITAFRMVNIDDRHIQEVLRQMADYQVKFGVNFTTPGKTIQTEAGLMYDAVYVFAIGLQTLEQSHTLRLSNVSCNLERSWNEGLSLINYINTVSFRGLTGPIQFKEGRRVQFKLDLLKLKRHALVRVGEWTSENGINITNRDAFFDSAAMNVTLIVTTILEPPYVMMHTDRNYTGNERFYGFCIDILENVSKDVGFNYLLDLVPDGRYGAKDPVTGQWNGMVHRLMHHEQPYVMLKNVEDTDDNNERFEGFCIDLLKHVATMVGFDYQIELVPDSKYGVIDLNTGEWNGIVRQLMDKKADLAVGSMTINYARESVIDFTKPFMNLGISILFKVTTNRQARLFSFMNPLAMDIWLYVLSAYMLVSTTMFVVARFSPYEWHNPHPCDYENDFVENQFSVANSFWFTIGTLMQQGSDLNPKATSTRIVGGIWWFFTLIIISSYTANLAAFLTVERMITPIESAEDLSSQTDIPYGTLESGSTMTFFRDSMIETYKKMWRFMENKKPSVFVPTYEEGIRRVLEGNYAFLMESTMIDYVVQRNCNLTQIGGLLDTKGYGIATPIGSPWRDKISLAILELQEKGEIQMLYDKWWKKTGDTCDQRNKKGKGTKANSLDVNNIGGVFVVLLCGLALAVIVAIAEFCYNSKRNAIAEKRSSITPHQSLCAEMGGELCFALQCRGQKRRPALKRKCSKCLLGTTYMPAMIDVPTHTLQPTSTLRKNSIFVEKIDENGPPDDLC